MLGWRQFVCRRGPFGPRAAAVFVVAAFQGHATVKSLVGATVRGRASICLSSRPLRGRTTVLDLLAWPSRLRVDWFIVAVLPGRAPLLFCCRGLSGPRDRLVFGWRGLSRPRVDLFVVAAFTGPRDSFGFVGAAFEATRRFVCRRGPFCATRLCCFLWA